MAACLQELAKGFGCQKLVGQHTGTKHHPFWIPRAWFQTAVPRVKSSEPKA